MKTTAARSDVHRPSAIITTDYREVGFLPHGECEGAFRVAQMAKIQADMTRTGGTWSDHKHGGNCDICGNVQAMTHVVFYHAPTNSYIRAGETCADKVGMQFNRKAFVHFVKCAKDAAARKAGKAKAQLVLADAGLAQAWQIAQDIDEMREAGTLGQVWDTLQFPERTIDDMVGKLVRYGSLSEKQLQFMARLVQQINDRPAVEAKRVEEAAALAPCPTGRVTITGKVLCVRENPDNGFGVTYKMLVLDDRNFKVWGSVPAAFHVDIKGKRVTFSAKVEPKQGENGFGFYSRPTKAAMIEDAPEAPESAQEPPVAPPASLVVNPADYVDVVNKDLLPLHVQQAIGYSTGETRDGLTRYSTNSRGVTVKSVWCGGATGDVEREPVW